MRPQQIKLKYKPVPDLYRCLNSPRLINDYLRPCIDPNFLQEEFFMICLNTGLYPLGWLRVNVGDVSRTLIDISLIASTALLTRSTNIILAHTHPSGTLSFSEADIQHTEQIKEALKLFNIRLIDHLIFTPSDYLPLRNSHSLT